MPTDKEIEAAAKAIGKIGGSCGGSTATRYAKAALTAVEQVRAWPTEAMIDAAELKMPELGRLQIRFLFETMMAASSGRAAEQVRASEGGEPIEIRRNPDETIDEIVAKNCKLVHIEQMSVDGWFMGIDLMDGSYWQFWFGSKNRKSAVEFRHTETTPAKIGND